MEQIVKVVGLSAIPTIRVARHRLPPIEKRVTLDKLTFDFIPEKMPQPQQKEEAELDYQTAADIFRQTYHLVYHEWPAVTLSLGKEWETVVKNARAADLDFQSFVAFNLAGYKLTHPHSPFHRNVLTAASSVDKIADIKKLCLERFNVADTEKMGMVLDMVLDNVDDIMAHSEFIFGSWIVGQKLKVGGDTMPGFYDYKELSLNPYWLAVEPTYYDCLFTRYVNAEKKFGSLEEQKHRNSVARAIHILKRRKTLGSTVFNSRGRIMHAAVKRVLSIYGLTQESFTYPDEVVGESYPFWNGLGLALLHHETLKAVLGDRHRLWR